MPRTLQVDGITVHVEGRGPQTLLMLHGWPDDWRLWDGTVAALKDHWRCARCTLPGFDLAQAPRPMSLDAMVQWLGRVADAVSPGQPLTLVLHDWGCVFGYEFAARHPERVARIVGVDVGDFHSRALRDELGMRGRWLAARYQLWLALAWQLGRAGATGLADRLTRWQARVLRCPVPGSAVGWQMNHPYAMQWFGAAGGLRALAPVEPACPMLFIHGTRKHFNFHSQGWLQRLQARPGSVARGLRAGHWPMVSQPAAFHALLRAWLEGAPLPVPQDPAMAGVSGDVAAVVQRG